MAGRALYANALGPVPATNSRRVGAVGAEGGLLPCCRSTTRDSRVREARRESVLRPWWRASRSCRTRRRRTRAYTQSLRLCWPRRTRGHLPGRRGEPDEMAVRDLRGRRGENRPNPRGVATPRRRRRRVEHESSLLFHVLRARDGTGHDVPARAERRTFPGSVERAVELESTTGPASRRCLLQETGPVESVVELDPHPIG
jgi:hypothetical protein